MRKKAIICAALLLLGLTLLGGCGAEGKEAPDADGNVASGEAGVFELPEAGLIFNIEKEYQEKGVEVESVNEDEQGHTTASVFWYYKPVTEPLFKEMFALEEYTPEIQQDFYEKMSIHSKCLMNITLVEEQEYRAAIADGKQPDDFSYWDGAQELGTNDGYVYVLVIPENDTEGMSEEELAEYEDCHAYMETVKKNLKFTERKTQTGLPAQMPSFTAKDLDGNTVTESIFSDKELTVVNIWGTFCTPCVEEMPALGEWAKELPNNVQVVGLITDISGDDDTKHRDLAVQITEKAGADFVQIIGNQDFSSVLNWVTGVPTTLFVDKNGKIVGEPIVGADVEGYKKFVEDYLSGK